MRDAVAAERRGIPAGLIATTAVQDTVEWAVRTFRWPHLTVALVDESLFGLPRDQIAFAGIAAAAHMIDGLSAPQADKE